MLIIQGSGLGGMVLLLTLRLTALVFLMFKSMSLECVTCIVASVAMFVLPTITTTMDFSAVNIVLAVLFTFIPGSNTCNADNGIILPPGFTYSQKFLLSCRDNANSLGADIILPHDLLRMRMKKKKIKKRGSRGGIKNRLRRRGSRHPLPVITLSNVRSLNNKLDELMLHINYDGDFRRSNLICFTETWLKQDSNVDIEGYTTIKADRDAERSQNVFWLTKSGQRTSQLWKRYAQETMRSWWYRLDVFF